MSLYRSHGRIFAGKMHFALLCREITGLCICVEMKKALCRFSLDAQGDPSTPRQRSFAQIERGVSDISAAFIYRHASRALKAAHVCERKSHAKNTAAAPFLLLDAFGKHLREKITTRSRKVGGCCLRTACKKRAKTPRANEAVGRRQSKTDCRLFTALQQGGAL